MVHKGYKVCDVDMHVMEPPDLWQKYIDAPFKHRAPIGLKQVPWDVRLQVDGKILPNMFQASGNFPSLEKISLQHKRQERFRAVGELGWPAAAQLDAMDQEGVDCSVLYPTRGLYAVAFEDIDHDFAAAIARAYNNWLYDYCQADPQRLYGAALIAPHDVDRAMVELERAHRELGFRAAFLRPNTMYGRNWHDGYYEPLWALAEDLGMPIAFHEAMAPGVHQVGDRFGDNPFLRHIACHPMEMMLAVMSVCGGGVLARHPGLKIAFLECNCGWVPWLLDRMDDHYEIRFFISEKELPEAPSRYFINQCFVATEPDEGGMKQAIEQMGDDNLVVSTDWPHVDSRFPEAIATFLKNDISAESKRKILWDNCSRLYGLE